MEISKSTAAQIVNRDRLFFARIFIETECERSCSRFVDNSLDVKTCDFAGILCRLALRVVEIRGHRDNRFRHRLTEVILRRLFHLLQNESADLLRAVLLFFAVLFDFNSYVFTVVDNLVRQLRRFSLQFGKAVPDEALNGIDRIFRVRHHLVFCWKPDDAVALRRKADDLTRSEERREERV